jgi:aspartate aminotransferase-like enzyme
VAAVLARPDFILGSAGYARTFYLDLHMHWLRQREGEVPFTMPVQVMEAFDRALERWMSEGVEVRCARYQRLGARLHSGLEALGLHAVAEPGKAFSHYLIFVRMPPRFDYEGVRTALAERGYEIYASESILRSGRCFFAAMGAIDESDVDRFLSTLGVILQEKVDSNLDT